MQEQNIVWENEYKKFQNVKYNKTPGERSTRRSTWIFTDWGECRGKRQKHHSRRWSKPTTDCYLHPVQRWLVWRLKDGDGIDRAGWAAIRYRGKHWILKFDCTLWFPSPDTSPRAAVVPVCSCRYIRIFLYLFIFLGFVLFSFFFLFALSQQINMNLSLLNPTWLSFVGPWLIGFLHMYCLNSSNSFSYFAKIMWLKAVTLIDT